jgi:hypothetical protein
MKQAMSGLKNTSARARGAAGGSLGEGKKPLPFEVYRAICRWLLEAGDSASMFCLMCRSRNTVFILVERLGWVAGAMTCNFAHTKTDQGGADAGYQRHLYANPEMPGISVELALGLYMSAFPGIQSGKFFLGQSQYTIFANAACISC